MVLWIGAFRLPPRGLGISNSQTPSRLNDRVAELADYGCIAHPHDRTILPMGQLTQAVALAESAPLVQARRRWPQLVVLVLLVGWLYSSVISNLVLQWWRDPNFSHGFFVPIFSLFLLLRNHTRLSQLRLDPSVWGLLIVILALGALLVGVMGAELFLSRVSLLLLMAGLIVFFAGGRAFQAVLFPWAFLLLMIPIPAIIFDQITFPLQILASKAAAAMLPLFGVPVLREGNVINLPVMPLEVAQACSGIRSLLSLLTLAIIYGYTMEKSKVIRIFLACAAVPIAISANSLRIVGTGLMVQYWSPDKAEGFFHTFSGWLIFLVSLGMIYLLHRLFLWAKAYRTSHGV